MLYLLLAKRRQRNCKFQGFIYYKKKRTNNNGDFYFLISFSNLPGVLLSEKSQYYVLSFWRSVFLEEICKQEHSLLKQRRKYNKEFAKSNERLNSATPKNPHIVVEILMVSGKIPIGKKLKIFLLIIIKTQFLIKFGSHLVKRFTKFRIN